MITREQIEEAFEDEDEDRTPFTTKNVDHTVRAITLLRERIPYEECKSIIGGAMHDMIFLCDVDVAIQHISEEDLAVLVDCNCFIDEDNDCIALYV